MTPQVAHEVATLINARNQLSKKYDAGRVLAFAKNYIVTDFIFDNNDGNPRGMYVLTHGESTLDEFE